jgi:hypothetical protein
MKGMKVTEEHDNINESDYFVFDTSKSGKVEIVEGRLRWVPAEHLSQAEKELIQQSIDKFNSDLAKNEHEIALVNGRVVVRK